MDAAHYIGRFCMMRKIADMRKFKRRETRNVVCGAIM
jgi:hypothetical protein